MAIGTIIVATIIAKISPSKSKNALKLDLKKSSVPEYAGHNFLGASSLGTLEHRRCGHLKDLSELT
jgi:hypothetical protein